MAMSPEDKPVCVVIDTNIWMQDSNLLLKTAMGSALIYVLKKSNGKIGLPEIIEEEIVRNTVKKGLEAGKKIDKSFETIEVIIGSRCNYETPNREILEATVKERLADLEDLIIRIPFTFKHARGALRRINEKSQPNSDKNQQFKDSAIWEAILSLLRCYTVNFITDDNAFFEKRDQKTDRLASNLSSDCQHMGGTVRIYKDMKSCLKRLQRNLPPLDYSNLILEIDKFLNQLKPDLPGKELLAELGFEIVELATDFSYVTAFLTEMKDKLALSFELCHYCADVKNTGDDMRKEITIKTKGDCLYELEINGISDLKMDFERVYWLKQSEKSQRGIVYGSAGGIEEIRYNFREPVDFIRRPELSKADRVKEIRLCNQDFFKQYNEEQTAILEIFLNKYSENGVSVLVHYVNSLARCSEFAPYGDVMKILKLFDGQEKLEEALRELQELLYSL